MCGIAGILGLNDAFPVGEDVVVRMRETLVHRGPDDCGAWHTAEDRVALAHRRLSIVDLSQAGRQPMPNEDATLWIAYNGEVYNHASLRVELEGRGHVYRSRTDTETILHLYEEEGPRCVERLDGMFAIAIWDRRRRELFLARDRLGVKPLYYAKRPDGFVFGSEIKALLEHPSVERDLDEEAFFHYLTFAFAPPPRTMFHGISKLAPAERMVVRADGSVLRDTYWSPLSPAAAGAVRDMGEQDLCERVRELLRESVRKRMMSDVPFGVFLSGGVDSSANVALMAELSGDPVRTFSTAPARFAAYDELRYARLVAQRYATDHHEVIIDAADMEAFLPRLLFFQDEPLADWTAVPQHFVSKLARDTGTIVVQAGEGADEIFHGYKGYADHRRFVVPFQRYLSPSLRAGIGRAARRATQRTGRGIRHGEALYDAGHSPLPYWGGALCFRGELKREIMADGLGARHPDSYARVERLWSEAGEALPDVDLLQRMTYVELKQRLPELLLMRLDRIAMASSVEAREPFLDHRLVELAMALPARLKHRDGEGKHVLRRAVADLLPVEILARPKQGFGTPMKEWLREDFGQRAQRAVRESSLAERGLLDYDRVDALFEAHRERAADWSYHIWNLYSVSAWHDRWVAGRAGAPA